MTRQSIWRAPRLLLILCLALASLVISVGATSVLASGAAPEGGVSCSILAPNGNEVTQVNAASFGDLAYWLRFSSSGAIATTVRFTVRPMFQSPVRGHIQDFRTDFSDVVTTPFGIPDWGANKTSGPYALTIRDNLGRTDVCPFEVVP